MPNTNTTKAALGESLKKLVLTKRLEKITINDLTTDCGIRRMAFYYHFQDIYVLGGWVCVAPSPALRGASSSSRRDP